MGTKRLGFVTGLWALFLLSAIACGRSQPASTTGTPGATGGTPKPGGVLVTSIHTTGLRSFDLWQDLTSSGQAQVAGIYNKLVRYDPLEVDKIVPDLAERWELGPDGKAMTFHLTRDAQWHDGVPFTSADVKATYDRLLDPKMRGLRAKLWLQPIYQGGTAPDPYTFQMQLKMPVVNLLPMLASAYGPIVPKHVMEAAGGLNIDKPIGTGPWLMDKAERTTGVVWKKNPNYFRKGYPLLDEIQVPVIEDEAARLAALKAGKIDLTPGFPMLRQSDVDSIVRSQPGLWSVYPAQPLVHAIVQINTRKPPLDNPEVRKAIAKGIVTQQYWDQVFEGVGVNHLIMDPKVFGDWALPVGEVERLRAQNVEAAKRALAAAGHPQGFKLTDGIVFSNLPDFPGINQVLQQQLKNIGIEGELKSIPSGSRDIEEGKYSISGSMTAISIPDALSYVAFRWAEGGGYEQTGYRNKQIDEWWSQATQSLDLKRSQQIVHQIQRQLYTDDNPTLSLGWAVTPRLAKSNIRDFVPAFGIVDGLEYETLWLDR